MGSFGGADMVGVTFRKRLSRADLRHLSDIVLYLSVNGKLPACGFYSPGFPALGELGQQRLQGRLIGRHFLRDLEMPGGEFELVEAYRTVRPEVSSLPLKSLRPPDLEGEGYDAICFASGKAARHFLESTTEAFGEDLARETLRRAKVVVLGPITAAAVEAVGIRVDAVAASPRDEDFATAVVEVLRS